MNKAAETTVRCNSEAGARLRSLVERIERLEEERKELAADIKDIYTEAQSAGFDKKVLRALVAERKQDANEVEEQRTLLDLYRAQIEGASVSAES